MHFTLYVRMRTCLHAYMPTPTINGHGHSLQNKKVYKKEVDVSNTLKCL